MSNKRDKNARKKELKKRKALSQIKKVVENKTNLELANIEITYDSVDIEGVVPIPDEIKSQMKTLHDLIQKNPKKAIPELEKLLKEFPNLPQIYNFLSSAYSAVGKESKSLNLVKLNYAMNPNYFFAKLNYAEMCLQKGMLDSVKSMFNGCFDISESFSNRKKFHISEAVGFYGVIGYYFLLKGDIEVARTYETLLNKFAPDHELTKRLSYGLAMF